MLVIQIAKERLIFYGRTMPENGEQKEKTMERKRLQRWMSGFALPQGKDLYDLKRTVRRGFIVAVLFSAAVLLSGCATSYNNTYDLTIGYGGLKSYNWATPGVTGRPSDLVVNNVQYLADQVFAKKGILKTAEKPDMLVSIQYQNEYGMNAYSYQIQVLTIAIQKADSGQLIWRGTASGSISNDTSSGDLKNAVEKILEKFPPKQ
jgi:hypothetical protein